MNKIRKLDNILLTAIIVFGVGLIGFAITSFLLSSPNKDIPFGFLLSGGIISIIHLISYLLTSIDKKRETSSLTILSIGLRLFLMLGILLILFLMYYRWNIKLFNVFVFVGMYTLATLVFVLLNIFSKRKE